MRVQSLASLSGSGIWHCRELWCRLQMQLGSGIAVAVVQASSYSSELSPSLGTSMCCRCSPIKTKKKKTFWKRHLQAQMVLPANSAKHLRNNIKSTQALLENRREKNIFWLKWGHLIRLVAKPVKNSTHTPISLVNRDAKILNKTSANL